MPSIFPDVGSGAVTVRTIDGICLNPTSPKNTYCPPASFSTSCAITALPDDCTARISPNQINAFESEMLCLAATMAPDGNWDCNSVCNLSSAFTSWSQEFTLDPGAVAAGICGDAAAKTALSTCLTSGDAGNAVTVASDGGLFVASGTTINTDGTTIAGAGTAADPITVIPNGVVSAICGDDVAKVAQAACLISSAPFNRLRQHETDNLLYVTTAATWAHKQAGVQQTVSLSTAGSTTSTVLSHTVDNLAAQEALTLWLSFDGLGNITRIGNGSVRTALEYSIDAGATWIDTVQEFTRSGYANTINDTTPYSQLGSNSAIVPIGNSLTIQIRVIIDVLVPYESGSQLVFSLSIGEFGRWAVS